MATDTTSKAFDWPTYVDAMSGLHGFQLDSARHTEVIAQLTRIHAMAGDLLDFPLPPEIEPAPTFRP